eukprot:m.28852 g.28852  ORF g.28852 m.28852 type:complete len:65 (-) comp8961_c0_seq1:2-196(-)
MSRASGSYVNAYLGLCVLGTTMTQHTIVDQSKLLAQRLAVNIVGLGLVLVVGTRSPPTLIEMTK